MSPLKKKRVESQDDAPGESLDSGENLNDTQKLEFILKNFWRLRNKDQSYWADRVEQETHRKYMANRLLITNHKFEPEE